MGSVLAMAKSINGYSTKAAPALRITASSQVLGTIESRERGFFLREKPLNRSGFGLHIFRKC
jgi:hypothetical protein